MRSASLRYVNMSIETKLAALHSSCGLNGDWGPCRSLYHWLTADGENLCKHSFMTSVVCLLLWWGGCVERINCVPMIQRGRSISWWLERLWLGAGEESFSSDWGRSYNKLIWLSVWTDLNQLNCLTHNVKSTIHLQMLGPWVLSFTNCPPYCLLGFDNKRNKCNSTFIQ